MGAYRYKMGRNVRVGDVLMVTEYKAEPDPFYPKMRIESRPLVPLVVSSISRDDISHLVFKDSRSGRRHKSPPNERVRILPDNALKLVAI